MVNLRNAVQQGKQPAVPTPTADRIQGQRASDTAHTVAYTVAHMLKPPSPIPPPPPPPPPPQAGGPLGGLAYTGQGSVSTVRLAMRCHHRCIAQMR